MLNVNIGGTKNWKKINPKIRRQWKVMDIAGDPDYKYDLNSRKSFPINDKSVDNYYMSHTLEHIDKNNVIFVLLEIRRTLKSGGLIRIVVPDIKMAIIYYIKGDTKLLSKGVKGHAQDFYPKTLLGKLLPYFHSTTKSGNEKRTGHLTVFDSNTLIWYLAEANFNKIQLRDYSQKSEVFEGLDLQRYKSFSIYLEAKCF
ncbi:MAG: class I SAM-dependent methyltransferase [Promethearchaeota archaeon]|jgi:ubiquinone/menaquinone biosynthesis C-methylase UbiE